ncbi:MAG: cysteine hydrolase [Firmicutes bacterium]|nr:cysteine hydrolase [Bacillota bacterium]
MGVSNLSRVEKGDCALIVIDMQSDFICEGAPIECPGGREILQRLKELLAFARSQGIPVIYTQEMHRPEKIDFGRELEREEPEHCVEGTPGVEIIEEIKPQKGDFVVPKRRYSGFYLTDLEILLKGLKKKTLIITGVATNVCVYATTLDAQQRDHHVIVISDCVAGTSRELHQAFLRNTDYVLGDVVTAQEMMDTLKK